MIATALVLIAGMMIQTPVNYDTSVFEPPTKVMTADGQPIDVKMSAHAAPFYGDFDEDGTPDLMVGEYHQGRLHIYPNSGSRFAPELGKSFLFMAGGKPGTVAEG